MSSESKSAVAESVRAAVSKSSAYARLIALFDNGTMTEFDPLALSEGKPAEVVTAFGTVNGVPVCAFSQNSDIAGGAVSKASAAKICKVFDYALKTGAPIVGIYDSTGARLKQGAEMLNSFGDMLRRSNNLSGVVPQIAVIAGTCVGTCSLLASSADIIICSETADYGIDTAGGNMTAQQAMASGAAHLTAPDAQSAVAAARNILALLPQNNLAAPAVCEFTEPSTFPAAIAAQKIGSGTDVTAEMLSGIVDLNSFTELSAGFGKEITTGLATMGGSPVGIVASSCAAEGVLLDRDSTAKAARFVRFCDAFTIPVITFVDCSGFASIREASMLAHAYAEATTPKMAVITGAAYGAAYVSMAGASSGSDYVVAWPTAVISPLAPETIATVLYSEQLAGSKNPIEQRKAQVEEYKANLGSPYTAALGGHIENVIDPAATRNTLLAAMNMLAGKRVSTSPKKHSNIQL